MNEILDKVAFAACFVAACGGNAPARAMEQQAAHACGGNEVPPVSLPSNASEAADGKASAVALNALAGADRAVLRSAEIASDRYGRLVAYAYTIGDGDELFVQGELVADGLPVSETGSGAIARGNF